MPNEYALLEGGQTQGLLSRSKHRQANIASFLVPPTINTEGSASQSIPSAALSHRWLSSRDGPVLLKLINRSFGGKLPDSAADVRRHAREMPVSITGAVWDAGKLRGRAKELLKKK